MTLRFRFASLLFVVAQAALADQPLTLVVKPRFPREPQGTMHYAEALTLSIGSARPLRLTDPLLPIPGPSFALPGSRFLLLGWSSTGSGMQSIHAFLLGIHEGAVKRLAIVVSHTDRTNSALLVRRDAHGSLALGFPEPPTTFLHNEDEWFLTVPGRPPLVLDAIRHLAFEAVTCRPDDLIYSPPFQRAPCPARVSWITVTETGLSLAPFNKP